MTQTIPCQFYFVFGLKEQTEPFVSQFTHTDQEIKRFSCAHHADFVRLDAL